VVYSSAPKFGTFFYAPPGIMPKTRIFQLYLFADIMDLASFSLTSLTPKATALVDELTQNDGHYADQGHSRLPFSILIKSPCATSC